MKFRMTLRILILIVSMTSFKSFAQGIDGTWIEAVRGCNLQLPETELKALVNRGGNTYLANSVLILNKGKFDVTVSDGDGWC